MPWWKNRATNRNQKKPQITANHELKGLKSYKSTGLGPTFLQLRPYDILTVKRSLKNGLRLLKSRSVILLLHGKLI